MRSTLPSSGIWTVADLAEYLGMDTSKVQQALTNNGIKTLAFSNRYKHKLFRLEDLKPHDKKGDEK